MAKMTILTASGVPVLDFPHCCPQIPDKKQPVVWKGLFWLTRSVVHHGEEEMVAGVAYSCGGGAD